MSNLNIGLVITTYNSEKWFKELYDTIPFSFLKEVVVVNGGLPYKQTYKNNHWIQHNTNKGAAQSRIDGIKYLQSKNIEHIFIIEDDMLIKNSYIFNEYTIASLDTGLKYFCFCSNAQGNGIPGNRTPGEIVEYKNTKIAFYREMNNEFTYHHSSVFNEIGYYDSRFVHLWDVEFVYRLLTNEKFGCGFRYFPDVYNSDKFICNHPESINNSRTNINNIRDRELPVYFQLFEQIHKHSITRVPILEKKLFLNKLKQIYTLR